MAGMLFFCKCALCYELGAKPIPVTQCVGNKCGQHHTIVLASAPELRALNGRDTYLDTGVEISFMTTIE